MKSREHNQYFSLFQFIAGLLATFLVIFSYVKYHKPLQYFFDQVSVGETVSLQEVFKEIDEIAHHIENTVSSHSVSVDSIIESNEVAIHIVEEGKESSEEFAETLKATAEVIDTFAQLLPFQLPSVDVKNQSIKFTVPEISLKTQQVKIPYKIITKIHERVEEITYPANIVTKNEEFVLDLGYLKLKRREKEINQQQQQHQHPVGQNKQQVQGACTTCKKLGIIRFTYPTDIAVEHDSLSITYPDKISIESKNKTISVPATPEMTMKEYIIDTPKITVENQEIMGAEQLVLKTIAERLRTLATSLGTTQPLFTELQMHLEKARSALQKTDGHLKMTKESIVQLHEHIAAVIEELEVRENELEQLREKFAAIAGLIPFLFAVLALLCAATAASGAAKLCVHHHDKKDCPPGKTSEAKGSCSPDQESQPGTPHQQYDGPQQEQSSVVQEPIEPDPSQHPAEQRREK